LEESAGKKKTRKIHAKTHLRRVKGKTTRKGYNKGGKGLEQGTPQGEALVN